MRKPDRVVLQNQSQELHSVLLSTIGDIETITHIIQTHSITGLVDDPVFWKTLEKLKATILTGITLYNEAHETMLSLKTRGLDKNTVDVVGVRKSLSELNTRSKLSSVQNATIERVYKVLQSNRDNQSPCINNIKELSVLETQLDDFETPNHVSLEIKYVLLQDISECRNDLVNKIVKLKL